MGDLETGNKTAKDVGNRNNYKTKGQRVEKSS